MSTERKNLNDALLEMVRKHGKSTLTGFFCSEVWIEFVMLLNEHIEDARNILEIDYDIMNIRYVQGQVNALRTIVDLADITVDYATQLEDGMPSEELTEEDLDDERGIETEPII